MDGDVAIWVRRDGTVVEQRLANSAALFTNRPETPPRQVGPALFTDQNRQLRTPPAPVPGVTNARGVAVVQVVISGTSRRPVGIFTLTSTGLETGTARVALLNDGGLAVWNAAHDVVIYSRDRLRALLNADVLTITDGRFILSDGTAEDGVIERLIADPRVMAGISQGLGAARCGATFGCPVVPRSTPQMPSFKYSWLQTTTPVKCVQSMTGGAALLQDGSLHVTLFGGIGGTVATNVVSVSVGHDTLAYVMRDGSLWYSGPLQNDWAVPRPVPGVTNARRVWVAGPGAAFHTGTAFYSRGVWFADAEGRLFRWVEDAPTLVGADGTTRTAPNPVELPVTQVIGADNDGAQTIFALASGVLLAYLPEQARLDDTASLGIGVDPATFISLGEVAVRGVTSHP